MGRPKKKIYKASEDSLNYVRSLLKNYEQMKLWIDTYPGNFLFHKQRFNPELFKADCYPTKEMLVELKAPEWEQDGMEQYLFALEGVYLLEHGIWKLAPDDAELAQDMLLSKMPRQDLEEKWRLSQSSISRKRRETINTIALCIESYFRWKTENLYM